MKNRTKTIRLKNFEESLRESFTTMSGMPQNSRGYATGMSSRTQSNTISTLPHGGAGATGLRGNINPTTGYNIDQIKDLEKVSSKAPPLLPFPLDNIFQDLVSGIRYIENVEVQLKIAVENNVTLPPERLKLLMKMKRVVSICKRHLADVGKHIETISIDDETTL